MIEIQQSKTADTRSCDYANVSKETLLASSKQREARRWVRENRTLIVLHALYQLWGLPTTMLREIAND